MPLADFEAYEKPTLRAVRPSIFRPSEGSGSREPRSVDHTSLFSVGGTKYSVPSDYRLSTVEIEVRGDRIRIFDPKTGIEIAAHTIVQGAAAPVVDDAHYTNRTAATEALRDELLARCPEDSAWRDFVEGMWQSYRRYFREHATRLAKLFATTPDREKLRESLARCRDLGLHSAQDLLDAYVAGGGVIGIQGRKPAREPSSADRARPPAVDRRSLDVYKDFLVDVAKRTGGQA
jgi:hypothetical protein